MNPPVPWWRDAVLYQIYPRSFMDSGGDGIGDIKGITSRLDHLVWLGVEGIWLNPTMPSPNKDWGYDVADYTAVDLELGTMDDLDELIARADDAGIRVLLDLVPNHTSDRHPWFVDAASSRDSEHRDWYVWADPKPDGSPPNNWVSVFGGDGAWEWHEPTGRYYLHNFLGEQPDLNWWNDDVRATFDDILRFWFDRGVAGFRIDVAHALVKDRELRDNPPAQPGDNAHWRELGQQVVYNMNRPEGHEILRRWRVLAGEYEPGRVLVGETYVWEIAQLMSFYGNDDELHLAFNFLFAHAPFDATALRAVVEETYENLPALAASVWFGSNHDARRFATRWCGEDERKIRCALLVLLTLHGACFLYYGDEIGMPDTRITEADLKDPVGVRFWPDDPGRDPCRTPMHWSASDGAGFTDAGVKPWLPIGDNLACNVEAQRDDPNSTLHLCRDLIALRKHADDLRSAPYEGVDAPPGLWAFRRGRHIVVLNMNDAAARLDTGPGTVVIATNRARDGERVAAAVQLAPWEGLVVGT
ncbi:MAG: alpha-amylase family glycosyl hydrolase [Actinomycetota bacterium]